MKFEVGQTVKVKPSWWRNANKGQIIGYKHEKYILYGELNETHKYYVQIGKGYFNWFFTDELQSIEPTFNKNFELKLLDQLIDTHLASGQFDVVKKLYDEKQHLLGGM